MVSSPRIEIAALRVPLWLSVPLSTRLPYNSGSTGAFEFQQGTRDKINPWKPRDHSRERLNRAQNAIAPIFFTFALNVSWRGVAAKRL